MHVASRARLTRPRRGSRGGARALGVARACARGGVPAAAALLERSANLTLDPSRRAERLLAAADAHLESGSYDRAAGLLAAAEGGSLDEMGRVQLDLLRARHAAFGGDIRAAPELFFARGTASRAARPGLGPAHLSPGDGRCGHGRGPRLPARRASHRARGEQVASSARSNVRRTCCWSDSRRSTSMVGPRRCRRCGSAVRSSRAEVAAWTSRTGWAF